MDITKKGKEEIVKLKSEIVQLDKEYISMCDRQSKEHDQLYRKALSKECDKIWRKKNAKETRISEIEKLGLSSKECLALKKELLHFKTIASERMLGSSDYTVVGQSKALDGAYVKVTYCKWGSFMRNVKGCGSLAGKTDINEVVELPEKEYNELLNQNSVHKTSFMGGHSERIVTPNGEVVQEK